MGSLFDDCPTAREAIRKALKLIIDGRGAVDETADALYDWLKVEADLECPHDHDC